MIFNSKAISKALFKMPVIRLIRAASRSFWLRTALPTPTAKSFRFQSPSSKSIKYALYLIIIQRLASKRSNSSSSVDIFTALGATVGVPLIAFGAGYYVDHPDQVGDAIKAAIAAAKPAIVEIPIDPDEFPTPVAAVKRAKA